EDWLKARKAGWKAKRLARKQQQDPRTGKRIKASGVESFVVNSATKNDDVIWHIVELQEGEESGLFHIWACTTTSFGTSQLQSFQLKVAKTIYLAGDVSHLDGRYVTRFLPHHTSPQLILQLELSEAQWKKNRKDVLQAMEDASIQGVYESQVTASSRALWTLGCVAKVLTKAGNSTTHLYQMNEIQPKVLSPNLYLHETVELQRIVLYISTNQKQQVGMWSIVVVDSELNVKSSTNWMVDRGLGDAPVRQKDWQTMWSQLQMTSTLPKIQTNIVKSIADVVTGVNTALAKYRDIPSIVMAHVPQWINTKKLRQQFRGLDAFPMIVLGDHETFPALTWRTELPQRLLSRVQQVDAQWKDVLECARYSQLPIGNMTGDPAIVMLDATFARILTRQQHLLWASSTSAPDLGGIEIPQFDSLQITTESIPVCVPGAYQEYSVELSLDGLAIQAMLVAAELNHNSGNGSVEEIGNCAETFRLLRLVATNLFKDFMSTRSEMADHLLQHFYRWVSSPSSLLYDPALHKKVKSCMHTLLLNLLAECRRLGATIIYADTSRILLSTGKNTIESAHAYIRFVSRTLSAHPWYQVLSLSPSAFYSDMLFLDIENMGGMLYPPDSTQAQGELLSKWNIARYLPQGVDEYFMILVGQFIKRRYEFVQRQDKSSNQSNDTEAGLKEYTQKIVTNYFTEKLLRLVPEITSHSSLEFPVLAGSHLAWKHPALELVKCVCHVWSLDTSVQGQVQQLKRALLKTMGISEYSDEAAFVNPSKSFVLNDIICTNCNSCRDVDLCREPGLMENNSNLPENQDGTPSNPWQCPRCYHLYDMAALEMRLVDLVQSQYSLPYQQTDVVCVKCRLPTEGHLRQLCVCSGTLVNSHCTKMLPPHSSLVKYDSPILISTTKDKKANGKKSKKDNDKATGNNGIPSIAAASTTQTEDILNSILPPKEWTEDGQLWVQYVSSTPATRLDVINLQEQLDLKLQQKQARETGICPVREELYAQCFDELIRQITINCAERGLLLLRVRVETRMSIAAYQTLYESSIAFGMRKALMAEQKKMDAEQKLKQLEADRNELVGQVEELKLRCDAIQKREEEKRISDEKKHNDEVELLKKANEQLKANLESLLSTSK
ncbi:DNA polymerase epsilon catalytic subunit, partial [Thraustotheca clavata]